MNKSAIQKYAIWARTEMIAQVAQRAYQYGITADGYGEENAMVVQGRALTNQEQEQRWELIQQIKRKGFTQVMEEVAYTWFNRFIALRFMEVNNYLPTHIRVFSDSTGAFKPEILSSAMQIDLEGLDREKVAQMIDANQTEELYSYLLLTQCNALNGALPKMFQKMGGYTELLLPNNILRPEGILGRMVSEIPEEDWTDQVQIIGWLYQYYNSELKDDTFALLKKNVKITKERIPSATQLFTPDWIVRYMVENSLGRLWIEGHPNDALKSGWKYYLDEAEQEAEVQAQLEQIRAEYTSLKPQDIKVIDPCMGSGHILVYAFDVLVQIYKSYGISERDAARLILENNLYGLDIDDRAAQLAYFAVMMKARQYDRRIFSRGVQPKLYAIQESNSINRRHLKFFGWQLSDLERNLALNQLNALLDEFVDAKEYGSILNISKQDWDLLTRFVESVDDSGQMTLEAMGLEKTKDRLAELVKIAAAMAQKYDVVVTNPPYMGAGGMSQRLADRVKKEYPDSKSDLFAVFIERCGQMTARNRYQAMITQHAWMFLASYEILRVKLSKQDIANLVHLGPRAFEEISGEIVQTVSFVLRNSHTTGFKSTCCRLVEYPSQTAKEQALLTGEGIFVSKQEGFDVIPGSPVAYWVSENFLKCYDNPLISSIAFSDGQILTGNNEKYLRNLWEINATDVPDKKWVLHAKGGEFRRWYGNIDTVVRFDPATIAHYKRDKIARFPKDEILFRRGITWTLVSMNPNFGVRELDDTLTFNKAAATILFNNEDIIDYVLGFLNSKVAQALLRVINPTMNNNIKDVLNMPYVYDMEKSEQSSAVVRECISISKEDWDSFETSWDFQRHPLLYHAAFTPAKIAAEEANGYLTLNTLADAYRHWEQACNDRFNHLKANEEELNRIFIDIYGLQDELTPEVEDKDVTVRKADLSRDIRSLISYAVGCMFGRYSLDAPGLAYAGGEWDAGKYQIIIPDADNIIPICDDDYFDDDITARFVKWVETVYGKETLEENLKFIANALGGKGTPRQVIRNYFLNDFYADHLKIYQKRPIYWLFDSGKKNGFKALIYMHRYQSDLLARMRTDYVHEMQERYRTQLTHLTEAISHASASERVKLTKQQKKLQDQALELQKYEEKIHHLADRNISIDLDDGVKHNYALFADVLAKIK